MMASLSDIAKKHGVNADVASSAKTGKFGKRRPWTLGDDESNEQHPRNAATVDDEAKPLDGLLTTDIKLGPNGDQTGTKVGPTADYNQDQSGTKVGPKWDQAGDEAKPAKSNWDQSGTKVGPQPGPTPGPKWDQSGTKSGPSGPSFSACVGLQKNILLCLFASCQGTRSRTTSPLSSEYLSSSVKTTTGAAKQAIKRLVAKDFIRRSEYKDGRGGWTRFEIAEDVFQDITRHQLLTELGPKWDQMGTKVGSQLGPQPGPTPSSSSSYLNSNSKPTTTEIMRARLEEWTTEDLDYSMLTDIGFGRSQVMQLRSLGIPFDVLQRSLVYFEFELRFTESGKSIKEPLALFMKRMRQNGCWEAPEEYQKRLDHFQTRFDEREQQLQILVPPEGSNELIS